MIDLYDEGHRLQLYELGAVVNQAVSKPKALNSLKPRSRAVPHEAQGMLKIPRKRG